MRSYCINVCLLLGTILLFFVAGEFGLRATGLVKMRDYTPPIYMQSRNPDMSYMLKPLIREQAFRSTITTNSLGFRSPELEKKKTIAILGDSITFGYGVENDETISAHLQQSFDEYNVLNAGTPGYHIGQEAALFNEKLAPLDLSALVLVFYWNDFETSTSFLDGDNVLRSEGWLKKEKKCTPITQGVLNLIPGKCWLDLHSAFYTAVKKVINTRVATEKRDVIRKEAQKENTGESITREDLNQYKERLYTMRIPYSLPRLFVIWPNEELHQQARKDLKNIAEEKGFSVLDLYEYFGNEMETLGWDYMHPSPASLKQAAEIIASALTPLLE